jgi:ribonuclease III
VLGLSLSSYLFGRSDEEEWDEGRLSKVRAQAVSGTACARVARALGLADRLRATAPAGVGRSVETLAATERVLAAVAEAAIGACYLVHGYATTAEAVIEAWTAEIEQALAESADAKSELQERLARQGTTVHYIVVEQEGPPHDRRFAVQAVVDGEIVGHGAGRSKKDAEQAAAAQALAAPGIG